MSRWLIYHDEQEGWSDIYESEEVARAEWEKVKEDEWRAEAYLCEIKDELPSQRKTSNEKPFTITRDMVEDSQIRFEKEKET